VPTVIKHLFGFLLGLYVASTGALFASDSSATVTEAVNQVTHGSLESSKSFPAPTGTHLPLGEYLMTGLKSRAELELANLSITRLGANTIFNYSPSNNEIDLQAGTVLFSKPKDGKQMNIKTASVTAAIVGTTGFIQKQGKAIIFGLVEGHSTVTIGGKNFNITSGEIVKFTPGQPPQFFFFNVPLFLKTSPLITKFKHHLPTQSYIDKEIDEYNDLVDRGFIQPPQNPFFLTDAEGTIPAVPISATDSAGKGLEQFNAPPPTLPPPPPPPQRSPGT
jgi:hypothetical protein